VSMPRSESFITDITAVFRQVGDTHLPTLAMGLGAIALIWALKRFAPKLPGVLIVVALTTLISWAVGFERNASGKVAQISDPELRTQVEDVARVNDEVKRLSRDISAKNDALDKIMKSEGRSRAAVRLEADIALLRIDLLRFEEESAGKRKALRNIPVVRQVDANGNTLAVYPADAAPAGAKLDNAQYSIRKVEGD
ncbi:MAG: SulP family inorganic anion transporter, partial [Thiobacillus sp.]